MKSRHFLFKMRRIKTKKAQTKLNIVNVVIGLILIVALIPIIIVFSAGQQQCLDADYQYIMNGEEVPYNLCCNTTLTTDSQCNETTSANESSTNSLSATERTLLGLIGLFLILAFIFNIVKASGLTKK